MKHVRLLIIALLAFAFTGCSSYNRTWKSFEDPTPDDAFTGKWKGSWTSNHNGHTGGLRAMITHKADANYEAKFHATFKRILQFTYDNVFTVTKTGDEMAFKGGEDLGENAGGVHQYEGSVKGDAFEATYEARGDRGVFIMERVTK